MEKTSGVIESREVKDVGEDQLITLTIGGKKFTAFSNSITEDVANRLSDVKQGDEVDLEFTATQKTNRFGKLVTYRNITDIIKVDRGEEKIKEQIENEMGRYPVRADDTVNRSISLSYANAAWIAGKVATKAEMFQLAEENVMFMHGPISDENGG